MGFFSRKSKGKKPDKKKPDKKKPDTKKTDKKKPDTKEPAASNPDANKPDVKGKGKELPSQYRSVSIRINRESAPYVEEVDYDSDGYVVQIGADVQTLTNHRREKAERRFITKEAPLDKLIHQTSFLGGTRIQKDCQYNPEPVARPGTPSNAIPHSSFTLVDEHPSQELYPPPMTGHKTVKPAGGQKQKGQRFADDTNLDRRPDKIEQAPRPFTYEGRANGRDTFHKTVDRERRKAEREALKIEVAKQSGAYVKPKTNSAASGSSSAASGSSSAASGSSSAGGLRTENVPPAVRAEQQPRQTSRQQQLAQGSQVGSSSGSARSAHGRQAQKRSHSQSQIFFTQPHLRTQTQNCENTSSLAYGEQAQQPQGQHQARQSSYEQLFQKKIQGSANTATAACMGQEQQIQGQTPVSNQTQQTPQPLGLMGPPPLPSRANKRKRCPSITNFAQSDVAQSPALSKPTEFYQWVPHQVAAPHCQNGSAKQPQSTVRTRRNQQHNVTNNGHKQPAEVNQVNRQNLLQNQTLQRTNRSHSTSKEISFDEAAVVSFLHLSKARLRQSGDSGNHPEPSTPNTLSVFEYRPHLIAGAKEAALHFPPSKPSLGSEEEYGQFFNPEVPIKDPQDPWVRYFAAQLVNNSNKRPPCDLRQNLQETKLRHFVASFITVQVFQGQTLSEEGRVMMLQRREAAFKYLAAIREVVEVADKLECALACQLPRSQRRYPPPPWCPIFGTSDTNSPSLPHPNVLIMADNLYDEGVQLLFDVAFQIQGFIDCGLAYEPLASDVRAGVWNHNLRLLRDSLHRIGSLVETFGRMASTGQWEMVAGMAEVLERMGGIWAVVTGTLRPPNAPAGTNEY